MTPAKPKVDWVKFLPLAVAAGGFIAGYATLQTQVSHNTQQVGENKISIERDLDAHDRKSAHGTVAREIGEVKAEIRGMHRRLRNLERRMFSLP